MSLLDRTKSLLRSHRTLPKKTFGQNFLIEPSIIQRMATYSHVGKSDTLLDIGAGLGFLTGFMADKCKKVLAIESDRELACVLREQFSSVPNVEVIEGDVLKTSLPCFNKIVSTPPYNISSRLLLWILNQNFDRAVFVFQREFASRLVAPVGDRDYGWLSVLTSLREETELLDNVSRLMFYPRPKIDSVITRLTPKRPELRNIENQDAFKRLVQMLFTQRNRKIKGAALPYLKTVRGMSKKEAVKIAAVLPFCEKRVRQLAPEDFGVLADALI